MVGNGQFSVLYTVQGGYTFYVFWGKVLQIPVRLINVGKEALQLSVLFGELGLQEGEKTNFCFVHKTA